MSLTRRSVLAAAALGALVACAPKGSRGANKKAAPASPHGDQAATAPTITREDIAARYRNAKPTRWGLNIPGITTRLPTTDKVVALTFDACGGPDGGTGYNKALIDTLRKHRAEATLFLNQRWITANPTTARELADDPLFELANHGTHHRPLSVTGRAAYGIAGTRDPGEVYDEVMGNHGKLTELTGKPPRFFRPGTAHCDDVAVRIATDLGERIVNFDVNGDAGATFTAPQVERAILSAKPGSIVIGHMNRPASGTASGVEAALTKLGAAGFRFASLSKYLG